nr:MAG TPA: hypothetical protein [Caudoviricetes sp.]
MRSLARTACFSLPQGANADDLYGQMVHLLRAEGRDRDADYNRK